MIIYLDFLIPIAAIIILSIFLQRQTNLLERALVFAVAAIVIVASKFLATAFQTNTIEYWNSYATQAFYYEDWDEWITKICTECVAHDEDGNCTSTRTYDCSYREYHSAYWEIKDNIGGTHGISESNYKELVSSWGHEQFEDMHRSYYTKDGNMYYVNYDGVFDHTMTVCTKHIYENRVKCSKSVFNFKPIDTSEKRMYGLYDYPPTQMFGVMYNYNPIIGASDASASRRLSIYNAKLGSTKRVHMLFLVFKNKPYDAAVYQEAYWKGGNKNEFIVCIGIDDQSQIKWTKVISWTEVEKLKVTVVNKVRNMKYDLSMISDTVANEVSKSFIKKDFRQFDYLTIEPTTTAVIMAFIITLIVTTSICIVVIKFDISIETIQERFQ